MAALDVGELLHQKAAAEDAAQAEAARNAELQQQMAQVPTLCCHYCLHSERILPKDCLCTSPESVLCSVRSLTAYIDTGPGQPGIMLGSSFH